MSAARSFFDVWFEGSTDAQIWQELGYSPNHGFSKEICMPPIPKANMLKEK